MSDPLVAAREALAKRDRVAAAIGYADIEACNHLRAALSEVDRLAAENAELRATIAADLALASTGKEPGT